MKGQGRSEIGAPTVLHRDTITKGGATGLMTGGITLIPVTVLAPRHLGRQAGIGAGIGDIMTGALIGGNTVETTGEIIVERIGENIVRTTGEITCAATIGVTTKTDLNTEVNL